MMQHRLLLVACLLSCAGCTQLLFVERHGGCAEIYGRNATQPIYLDANRVGKLRSRNHHSGRPLDMVLIEAGSELSEIGVENITITANPIIDELDGCVEITDGERLCVLSNQRLLAAGTVLEFGARSDLETWQILRDTEEYVGQIAHDCTHDLI